MKSNWRKTMEKYYLAVDIGASSGRHILGHLENGRMVLEEIYRFPNGMTEVDGEKIWDIAKRYNSCKDEIMSLNNFTNDTLNERKNLIIPIR